MSFYKLGVNHFYTQILEENFITSPTPIQELAIPEINNGRDIIAEAHTGTGKTLAFLLPALQKIDISKPHISLLVIAPTRELAIQITEVAKLFYDVSVLNIYGGQDFSAQLSALDRKVDCIIATPGRLLHHLSRGRLDLSNLDTLVIDEADNLFKGGFLEDVELIMEYLPDSRQTLLFSATIDNSVSKFAKKYMKNHKHIIAPKEKVTLDNITQYVITSSNRKKVDDLLEVFKRDHPSKAIIFCRSRIGVDTLHQTLVEAGVQIEKLHGGLSQAVRESVMKRFKDGEFKYLVTTDVASRGLDISLVSHVVNYNLPDLPEDYVHRIGRTGRAGYKGVAYTILTGKDEQRIKKIEEYIEMEITKLSFESAAKKDHNPRKNQYSKQGNGYRGKSDSKYHKGFDKRGLKSDKASSNSDKRSSKDQNRSAKSDQSKTTNIKTTNIKTTNSKTTNSKTTNSKTTNNRTSNNKSHNISTKSSKPRTKRD